VILVDTPHLRRGHPRLAAMLERNTVQMHPLVMGELACGSLVNRRLTLELLAQLPKATVASHDEVMYLLENRRLHGKGIGYVDACLLASAVLGSVRLWTLDRQLHKLASAMG